MASRLYLTFGLCSLVTRVGTGRLCDVTRVNPQYLFQGALIVEGVSTLLCTLAKSFTGLVLYCIVLGLANGTEATCANLVILNSVPAHRRPQAYGIWLCAQSVTMLIGAPLGGTWGQLTSRGGGGSDSLTPTLELMCSSRLLGFKIWLIRYHLQCLETEVVFTGGGGWG